MNWLSRMTSSDRQEETADVAPSDAATRQDTKDEKTILEGDPEKLQHQGDEQTTQIDPAVASRIAASGEDFMVRPPLQNGY